MMTDEQFMALCELMRAIARDVVYREGRCAFMSGKPFEESAYSDERSNEAWQQGWADAREEAHEKSKDLMWSW